MEDDAIIAAFLVLLTVSVAGYHILDKHLLDMSSYKELVGVRSIVEGGKSSGMLNQLTAAVYGLFSTGEFDSSLLVTIAKALPLLLSIISAVAFYFMLRQMLSKLASLAGAVFLLSSPLFLLRMRSGLYSQDSLGMCLFILACCSLFVFYDKKNHPLLAASLLLFLLSSLSWSAGWVMVAAVALSLFIQLLFKKEKHHSYAVAGVVAASILSLLITPPAIPNKPASLTFWASLPTLPLIILGFILFVMERAGRYECKGRYPLFTTSLFLLSIPLSGFDAFPSSFCIALFSAFAVNELAGLRDQRAALASLSLLLLFVSFEFTQTFMKFEQAIVASFLIAASSVFIVSLYRERRIEVYIVFSIIALSVLSSISSAALSESRIYDPVGEAVDSMMEWMREQPEGGRVWAFRITPLVELTTGKEVYENDTELAQFLLSNSSVEFLKERNVTRIVVDASMFDNIEMLKTIANNTKVRIDSFRLYKIGMDQANNPYAVFVTRDGRMAVAQLDPYGNLLEGDVTIIAGEGMRVVPLKKFLRVGSYRLIYPQDNYRVNLFLMFFENVDGLREAYASENGEMKVFEVVG